MPGIRRDLGGMVLMAAHPGWRKLLCAERRVPTVSTGQCLADSSNYG